MAVENDLRQTIGELLGDGNVGSEGGRHFCGHEILVTDLCKDVDYIVVGRDVKLFVAEDATFGWDVHNILLSLVL